MPSPWYDPKKTDSITLKAGTAQKIAEVTVDECAEGDWALMACNIKLRLSSSGPKKFDWWMDRVSADDQTAYGSATFPGPEDDYYEWPVWIGEIVQGETYRWMVRLESGLSGSLSTRYAKGIIIPKPCPPDTNMLGLTTVEKYPSAEEWTG